MHCWKCGKELEEGSQFCRHCGAPVHGGPDPQTERVYLSEEKAAKETILEISGEDQHDSNSPDTTAQLPAEKPKKKKGLKIIALILLLALLGGGGFIYYKHVEAEKEAERQRIEAEQRRQAYIDEIKAKMPGWAEAVAVAIEEKLEIPGIPGAVKLSGVMDDVTEVIEEGSSMSFKLSEEHMFEDIIFYNYGGRCFAYYGELDENGQRSGVGFIAATYYVASGTQFYGLQAEWENDVPNGRLVEVYVIGLDTSYYEGHQGMVKDGLYDGDFLIATLENMYSCVFHDGVPEIIEDDGERCAIGVSDKDGSYLYIDKGLLNEPWSAEYPH